MDEPQGKFLDYNANAIFVIETPELKNVPCFNLVYELEVITNILSNTKA